MCQNDNSGKNFRLFMPNNQHNENFHTHVHNHGNDFHEHPHHHEHGNEHDHDHDHDSESSHGSASRIVNLGKNILQFNNIGAARNRGYFEAKEITSVNLVSSPGSGKTSLLEKTLTDLKDKVNFYVIEGDQQTMNDSERINAVGIPVVQINTGSLCHLESNMIYEALKNLNPKSNSLLMIENVGNLVCPSAFDLGEDHRIVIISTTEGDDKPIKYPDMFLSSDICIINKIDLLPYLNFNVEKAKDYARKINPKLVFFEVSATTGEGMDKWYEWLLGNVKSGK
jgi:hydrogenase nickel incorporation protein HypB